MMSLRGRVGRHTQAGARQCQNWSEDQETVIALLNRIHLSEGGAGGSLTGRIVSGLSSDDLYRAIARFEDRYFPGQRSGFVDPGGRMLIRMEQFAARAGGVPGTAPAPPQAVVETPLDILRRNVLDETPAKFDPFERILPFPNRVLFAPLITMAVKHIDRLKDQGFVNIPWEVELFGRAHITLATAILFPTFTGELRSIFLGGSALVLKFDGDDAPRLPEMKWGAPVDRNSNIVTEHLSALLLYNDGKTLRLRPWHWGDIRSKATLSL